MDHLNTGQHAGHILKAWKRGSDLLEFDTALKTAWASYKATRSISRLEDERQEVLKTVVEHLRDLRAAGERPAYSRSSGAVTLLSHLSDSSYRGKQIENAESRKN